MATRKELAEQKANDRAKRGGLDFAEYHVKHGRTRDETLAIMGGMYDFMVRWGEIEASADAAIKQRALGGLVDEMPS